MYVYFHAKLGSSAAFQWWGQILFSNLPGFFLFIPRPHPIWSDKVELLNPSKGYQKYASMMSFSSNQLVDLLHQSHLSVLLLNIIIGVFIPSIIFLFYLLLDLFFRISIWNYYIWFNFKFMAFRSPLLASSTFNQSYSCHLPFLIHSIFSIQLSCNPNFKKVQRFCPLTQFPAIYGTMHPSPLIDLHIEKTNTPLGHTKKKKKLIQYKSTRISH